MKTKSNNYELYPPITPFNYGFIEVDEHKLYFEECGNPNGIPIIFFHGGPGSGCYPEHRRLFNPKVFHVVFLDQRGSGRSKPFASTFKNNTGKLIEDFELLRKKLSIEKFILFGGSWGSTLALSYGIKYPNNCIGFVLRGVFLGTKDEVNWFLYDMGRFYPEAYEKFKNFIVKEKRDNLFDAYYELLFGKDIKSMESAAKNWVNYENSCSSLFFSKTEEYNSPLSLAKLECHYFKNDCFLPNNHILKNLYRISHLPVRIIQGRHDVICPPNTAYNLKSKWGDNAKIKIVDDAGHSTFELGIQKNLMYYLDEISLMLK